MKAKALLEAAGTAREITPELQDLYMATLLECTQAAMYPDIPETQKGHKDVALAYIDALMLRFTD